MKKEKISNYTLLCQQWAHKFLQMDHAALLQYIPQLSRKDNMLTLSHFGVKYGVDCYTGQIHNLDQSRPVPVTEQLNIYTLFGYIQPGAKLQNCWVNFSQLRGTAPFDAAFRRGIIQPFARTFSGHIDRLHTAMQALGALPLHQSDCGYQVDAFACIPVRYLFWEGDDEFTAQANLLFDASATDFTHEESIVSIAAVGLRRLTELAGLRLDTAAIV